MKFSIKNCCHSSDIKPRFHARSGDRVLVRYADRLCLAEIVEITADGKINVKRDELISEITTINNNDVISLILGD